MDKEKAYNYANGYRTKLVVDSAVDEWREQHQAEAQAEYENMGVLDRINDTISRNIDTEAIGNTVQQFGNTLWETGGDIVDSARQWNENRLKFLHESANLQEKALNGQVTEEDINNLRQSGRDASVSLTNIAASPFRQAARNFIKNNAADNNSFFQGAAQSLQQTDVNLEYFMTPAEKLQKSREIEQDLGIPAGSTLANNDAYREALEIYNFKQKSDNIEDVWEKYPELQRIADMDPEGAAVALHDMQTVKNTRGVVDTFMTFLEKGNTELEYNNLQYKIMMGRATNEEVKRAEDLKARVEAGNKLEAPGFFQSPLASMAAGVAGSLPEMGQSLAEGAEGGAAAGAALTVGAVALTIATGGTDLLAAGGVAAMRAAIMRALASEAGRKLLKTGLYSGLIHGMGAPESGRNYSEMKGMKKSDGTQLYTDEEARNWSLLRGYTNAAIEVANFGMAAKAVYPVANRVFAQSVEQITRETLGRETLKDFARGRVGDWLKLTATESAEEAAQSVADDVISNVALSTKGEDAAQYKQYSIMDIATRAGQAFIESLPASMGFATIGAGVGTITGAGRMARARKRAADMERNYGKQQTQTMMGVMAVEQLQKAVEQGNLDKVAPDVQKKVLKEQLAGTEFSRAYIDVEMAMQKENGREDLQKVAEAAGMSADELEAAITVNGYIPVGTETLAQAKVSPDLLDSVSFSEDAESMARMRENGKTIIEDYKKNFDKMVKRQEKLADAIIDNNMKDASAEQKAILRQVMLSNISNPAQAWNDLRKMYNDELQEKIAPALEALKRGMGNAGLMETQDEQGNTKTIRYTENDEWYRNFYKTFKRKPTTAELEDMAIAMVTGDSNAPKVAGWIPDSAEAQAEFEKNRPVIEQLKNNIALLDSVKEEAKKLTGVEMELTQGLTPEAFKVYRAISSWTNKAGGKIARAGRISAILVARHADLYAEAIRKKTGKNYTAEDYIRERLGFQLVQAGIDQDGVLKQLAGVNARTADMMNYQKAQTMLVEGQDMETIHKETGWLRGNDGKWRFEIPDNLDKISWQAVPQGKGYASLWQIYDNNELFAAYPNLSSIPVRLVDMEEGDRGRVTGRVYRVIEINKNLPDAEKSKTLIHEIQHMIQAKEGFATGGSIETARKQIEQEIESVRRELAGIPNSKEYMQADNDFMTALENGDMEAMDAASEKVNAVTDNMEQATIDKISDLSGRLKELEQSLQDNRDFALYLNLGGEQEARSTAVRAEALTDLARARKDAVTAQLAFEKEIKKHSKEERQKLFELQQLENKFMEGLTDEEETRYAKLREEIDETLLDAWDDRSWANDTVEEQEERLKMPAPHKENAIIVFGGQEISLSQEPSSKKITIDGRTYQSRFGGEEVSIDDEIVKDRGLWAAINSLENTGDVQETIAYLQEKSKSGLMGVAKKAKAGLEFLQGKNVEFQAVEPPAAKPTATAAPIVKKEKIEKVRKTYGPFTGEGYNPRELVPKVRGGWTEKKILKYLKEHGTPNGVKEAIKLISEFDSVEDLKEHMFFHGSQGGAAALKPSITMSDREIERIGGGGYGEKYWGISVTPNKRVASRFSGDSRTINIYPLILAKNAIVEEAPELEDAADINDSIVDYWTRGVDAVWIGDKNAGEQELLILNPRAVVNIGRADTYDVLGLGTQKNPLKLKNDAEIAKMLEVAKEYTGNKEQYEQKRSDYEALLRDNIFFQRAWHGTPHDFEEFDLGAIGTGEGAQAHGWGLYFAGNREVSEGYRERLALDSKEVIIDGETYFYNPEGDFEKRGTGEVIEYGTPLSMAVGYFSTSEGKVKDAIESLQKDIKEATPKKLERWGETWNKAIDILENKGKNWAYKDAKGGKLFEVEIPDDDVLLDEQKPLSQQPEKVKEAIINILAEETIIDTTANNEQLINEEIETLEYVQKKIIESKDLSQTALELIEDPIYEYGTVSEESVKIFDLLGEGKRSQGLLLAKQLIAKLTNEKNKLLDRNADKQEEIKKVVEKKYRNTRGEKLYELIAYSPREASEKLNAAGVKGITYEGGTDGRCFVIFDDKAIAIIEKYNQQINGSQDGQGWIDIKPGPDGRRIVHILETADESTFMHEMAHAFLFDLEDLAQSDKTYAKELEIVNQWAEWKKGDYKEYKRTAWADEFAKREQAIIDAEENHDYERAEKLKAEWRQERFARGFEMYLREGNAPAPGLKAVFRMFKQFLNAIYKAFTGDGGKPSEPVRRVMDRMIATDEEIEIAALNDRYTDLEKAGGEKLFDESNKETMKRWLEEEKETAKEKVLKIVMRDLEKKRQKEYAANLDKERERYKKELEQENIFLARNLIAETKNKESATMWFDTVEKFEALNATVPAIDVLVARHMQQYTEELDKSMIDNQLTQEAINKAMESGKYKAKMERYILKGMERKKQLINQINEKAQNALNAVESKLNNLPDDTDLQLDKKTNPTVKEIIKELTKLRFAAKWDTEDINRIEDMLKASTRENVRKAIKNFKERQRKKEQNIQDIEEATKGMEKMYRDLIKQTTADRPMSETCNIKYYKDKERNTDRRVKQMAKIQNWEMAIHQQRQKVFYAMMVKQARENRDTRDKMIKDLQRKLNAKTVKIPKDERYWFNRILYIMRLNPTNPKLPEGGVTSLDNIFKEQQESLENIYVPDQLIRIRDEGENFGDYNKMTLNDFREAYEDLVRLYELGRTKFNFKSIAGKSFEDVAQELMSDPSKMPGMMALTRKVGPNQGGIGYIDTLGNFGQTGDDIAKNIQKYHNSILKPENILEMLGKKAQKYIYGLLEKAAEQEAELAEKNLRALQDINAMYTREEHQSWTEQKYDFPGTKGWKITKENILMMAINYGSEKNRQRLIGGLIEDGRKKNNMSAEQVRQAIEDLFTQTMTAKDWQYIQKLWDHIGSYWHDTAAVEEKLNGIALGKVEPLPFSIQTADGKVANLKGGYMHIKYDFEKSSRAEENEINDMAMSISAGARRLGVGRGMTKARTEHNVYMEVDLHFDVIEQHLQDVIHNIAYRIPIRDIYRLLHYKNYSTGVNLEDYIKESLGVEAFRVLDAWAMDAWRQVSDNRNSAEGSLNKFARYLRTNATMAIMGFKIKPVLENIGNLPIAMNQIGSIKMLNALFGFYPNRGENYKEVIARSAFMRTRAENLDRDLKNQPGVFRAGNKLLEVARQHAYDMLVITDLMVSAPMWWQVYHESITPKIKEVQKENEENIQKRMDLATQADNIRAEIAEHFKGAADIDEHLKTRRYGTPAEIEALRSSEFAGISEGELRAQWGQHQNEIRNLNKELFKVEQEQEKANQLPVYSDDEILEEAKQRAVFAADKVVRDTIGSGRVIDQSAVQRSTNEFVRLFTAFYSFFNAQWNLIYMAYAKSRYAPEGTGSIEKWAPLAKTLMFNVFLSALLTTAVGFAFGLKGDSDDEKFETVTKDGKKEKVERPWLERFLKAYAKESLSVSTGGLYGIRDIVQLMGDYAFSGQNFGYKMGSVATRGISETLRAGDMLIRKGEKDAEIQAREDKRQKTHEEKLKKLKGKKRREYLQKWEEEQKYRKPPKRITYEEILSHGVSGLTTLTAAKTGITTTLTDAITHTMMYMMDKDMRYDPSWKNIIWSAIFDKKPVEREIPKKPPKEETKTNKKKRKQSER